MLDGVLLEAKGLSKSFGALRVLQDISFDVRRGEVLGILGPNGAGKTTLFNLISGDLRNDAGELVFEGQRLVGQPPYTRCKIGIGRTYQIPRPYVGMSTFENLLVAATFGAILTTWVTFLPCFLWIFAGAPFIERLRGNRALSAALSAITAAVVGVILNLAVWFGIHTLFEQVREVPFAAGTIDLPVLTSVNWPALALAVGAILAMFRFKAGMLPVLGVCSVLGAAYVMII